MVARKRATATDARAIFVWSLLAWGIRGGPGEGVLVSSAQFTHGQRPPEKRVGSELRQQQQQKVHWSREKERES